VATNTTELVRLRNQLENEDGDLLAEMLKAFMNQLMSADADGVCGAGYGERSPDSRNGYRPRDFDTRAGTIELSIPNLGTRAPEPPSTSGEYPKAGVPTSPRWGRPQGGRRPPSPALPRLELDEDSDAGLATR
jgi:Transposase, Mutator family